MAKQKITLIDEFGSSWIVTEEDVSAIMYKVLDGLSDLQSDEYCIFTDLVMSTPDEKAIILTLDVCARRILERWQSLCDTKDLLGGDINAYDELARLEQELIHALRAFNFGRRLALGFEAESIAVPRRLAQPTPETDMRSRKQTTQAKTGEQPRKRTNDKSPRGASSQPMAAA